MWAHGAWAQTAILGTAVLLAKGTEAGGGDPQREARNGERIGGD